MNSGLKVGSYVKILSKSNKWRDCIVLKIVDDKQLKIHYDGFNSRHDEWVDATSKRLGAFLFIPIADS